MSWKKAIIQILTQSDNAMHYSDIAEKIVEENLRTSVGATPARTVIAQIGLSIKENGDKSPFIRVGRGVYFLRNKTNKSSTSINHSSDLLEISSTEPDTSIIIQAFGMFWQRDFVSWSSNPQILGKQQIGAEPVNFSNQLGVYLLYDRRDVIYVGRSVERPIGKRLYEHTQDRLQGRWDRFSWFGLLNVTEKGQLEESLIAPTFDTIISTLEALLIEGLEPPQNRKRGDNFNAIEYLQSIDPELEKKKMKALLDKMGTNL